VSTAVRRAISLNIDQKTRQVIEMVGILKKNYHAALNTTINYGPMVNDFEFIQPFGGNRVPIDEGEKPERNPSGLNGHQTVTCGDHNKI
jgi:hypothetical protein